MNENQIAFIAAVNDERYHRECSYYIDRLKVPDGMSVDMIAVHDADSMCSAYNLAMESSEAKYKVYLHQDVFIRNQNFLIDLLRIFKSDPSVGMIGVVGGDRMPKTGVAYRAWNAGIADCRDPDMAYYLACAPKDTKDRYVEAVDGLLIATQYDIPWREDLCRHFDFYDISASFEMRKRGYRILVPYQKVPWVLHDSNFAKMVHYDEGRRACLEEYPEFWYADGGFEFEYHREWELLGAELAEQIQNLMESGRWEDTASILRQYRLGNMKDSVLEKLGVMSDIECEEQKAGITETFFSGLSSYEQMDTKYMQTRFLFFRLELGLPESAYETLTEMIADGSLSCEAVLLFVLHAAADKKTVLAKIREIYQKAGETQKEERIRRLYENVKEGAALAGTMANADR